MCVWRRAWEIFEIPAELICSSWEMFFVATETRPKADTERCSTVNGWRCSLLFKLTTISIKAAVELNKCGCVWGGGGVLNIYRQPKVFACVGFVCACKIRKKKETVFVFFAQCANYSYLSNISGTHKRLCLCVFYLYVCACISRNSLAFPYFKQPVQYKGRGSAQHDCL